MFYEPLLTLAVEALQSAFGESHPNEDFRGLPVNIEYPLDEISYPGFYINFTSTGDIRVAGIGHIEHTDPDEETGAVREVYRWVFAGVLEITICALSNLERARMIDELAKTVGFGTPEDNRGVFREVLEHNDLIGVAPVLGSFTLGGFAETPGTPWQTDDVIYEATLSMTLAGEVVLAPSDRALVPLAEVRYDIRRDDEEDTTNPALGPWL